MDSSREKSSFGFVLVFGLVLALLGLGIWFVPVVKCPICKDTNGDNSRSSFGMLGHPMSRAHRIPLGKWWWPNLTWGQ